MAIRERRSQASVRTFVLDIDRTALRRRQRGMLALPGSDALNIDSALVERDRSQRFTDSLTQLPITFRMLVQTWPHRTATRPKPEIHSHDGPYTPPWTGTEACPLRPAH